jgi:hypothetical protein
MLTTRRTDLRSLWSLAALCCGVGLAMPAAAAEVNDAWGFPLVSYEMPGAPAEAPTNSPQESASPGAQTFAREIADYLDLVEERTRERRLRGLDERDRSWVLARVASLRAALARYSDGKTSNLTLQRLTQEFAVRVAELDQGGIVCRLERRTGSTLLSRRCLTRKLLEQQTIAEQERWRRITRPGTASSKPLPL